jgi:predicted dehydrogenase
MFIIRTFSTIEEALSTYSYNVAFVCTPNHLHVKQSLILAEHGIHLFIEKPIALDKNEVSELLSVVDKNKVLTMVACNLRFHLGVQSLQSILSSSMIGTPLYVRSHFSHYLPNWRPGQDYRKSYSADSRQGGGILLDAIHEPDYLCWLFGRATQAKGVLGHVSNLELNVEDTADYVLWHGTELYSQVHVDYLRQDKSRGCEIIGSEGTAIWNSSEKNPEKVKVAYFSKKSNTWITIVDEPKYDLNKSYLDEVNYFFNCVSKKTRPMNGVHEAAVLIDVLNEVKLNATNKVYSC